jgi:hypothetical protein
MAYTDNYFHNLTRRVEADKRREKRREARLARVAAAAKARKA